mmetsp:Transcript_30029/g.51876  ORF Transcript_30029/g.51876 Transcript_30029/m.51876 type:complete len:350 (+) Transcript_30029:137-1186(+)
MQVATKVGTVRRFFLNLWSKGQFIVACFCSIFAFFSVEAFYSYGVWNCVALSKPRVITVVSSNKPSASPIASCDWRWEEGPPLVGVINAPVAANAEKITDRPLLSPWNSSMVEGKDILFSQLMKELHESLFEKLEDVESAPIPPHLAYKEAVNGKKGCISTNVFKSKEFKKIRTTSVDCGNAFQVFNVFFQPHTDSDMPMFGAELLTMGERHLVVVDLLPIFNDDEDYVERYIAPMDAVKAANPHLIGQLSGKHYDEAKFFSRNMLFARKVGEERVPEASVAPAFKEYLDYYLDLAAAAPTPANAPAAVAARHAEFHAYSHAKNPAKAVFNMWFGQEWGQDFSKFIHQP